MPADQFGCIVTSRRIPVVVTGLNVTVLNRSFSTPNCPAALTGFQSPPSLYSKRHDAGTRTSPRPVSSNQYSWHSETCTAFSKAYSTHSVELFLGHQSK